MIGNKQFLRIVKEPLSDKIGVYFGERDHRGILHLVSDCTLAEIPDGGMLPSPSLRLDLAAAQSLMDELWDCGIRPAQGSGSAGSLAATERHLSDMQGIVRHILKMNK